MAEHDGLQMTAMWPVPETWKREIRVALLNEMVTTVRAALDRLTPGVEASFTMSLDGDRIDGQES